MLAVGRPSRQWNRSTHEHCTAHMAADGAHPFLKCTVHCTPQRPHVPPAAWLFHAGCSWVPERCFCSVLIALSGRCVWNKYAGHPSKWQRFPSWVAPVLLMTHTALRYISWTRTYSTNNSSERTGSEQACKCNMLGYSGSFTTVCSFWRCWLWLARH